MRKAMLALAGALLVSLTAAACGGSGSASATQPTGGDAITAPAATRLPVDAKPFPIDPSEFTTEIDNPYWPIRPGSHWVYREVEDGEAHRDDVTVTDRTKTLGGIEARVVHDRVSKDGETLENTDDYYAQDSAGNLWYLGENTAEYENGKLKTTEGTWAYGTDGAQPGVIVPAHPKQGMKYREEYYKGHAEDGASIISTDALAKVPYGRFENGVQTRNFSAIEPDVIEEKIYAQGVGVVLEITVSGGSDRDELLSYSEG
jgi:hypothetical protein